MASCTFESCLSTVLENLEHRSYFFQLKDEQKRALRSLFERQDVVGILPTGFGKSLIFQLLALLATEMFMRQGEEKQCALEQGFIDACLKNENGHFHNNMAAVVIDECHTIETWTGKRKSGAKGEKTRQAFRGRFGDLVMLRSLRKEGTPFLALTGHG
ncbi:Hypothetical predicted protein [Paramuricea clavata]|uniref:DNA 3'-5' helicase n=1 Tax=Paramuricea clavata TaxID=317549 RepID=A0A6S7I4S6_PARCT|nr:Hypothetical predicted protein [Paramuricea clavata]